MLCIEEGIKSIKSVFSFGCAQRFSPKNYIHFSMKSVQNVHCTVHMWCNLRRDQGGGNSSKNWFSFRYYQVFLPKENCHQRANDFEIISTFQWSRCTMCTARCTSSGFKKGISFTSYIFPLFNKIGAHQMDLRKEQRVASCHWQLKLKWKCEAIKALTKLIAKQKRTKCKSQRRRNPIKFLWEVSIFIFRYIEYTVLHWDIDKWHLRWIFLYLMKASKFDECDWFRDSCNSVDIDESFTLTLQGDMVVFNFTM